MPSSSRSCDTCKDARYVSVKQNDEIRYVECKDCDGGRQRRLERYANLPQRDPPKTFASFDVSRAPEAFEAARQFARHEVTPHSLTFVGPNGTGKTHLLEAIAREMVAQELAGWFVGVSDNRRPKSFGLAKLYLIRYCGSQPISIRPTSGLGFYGPVWI